MKKRISHEGLKLIACVSMLLDHLGATLFPIPALRLIGRLSFPIYCFLLAEGVRHTRDPKKYLLRLGIGAILSEIPYDLLFYGRIGLQGQNVMVTLFLGAAMLMLLQQLRKPLYKFVLILFFGIAAEFLQCDYGSRGIFLMGLLYLTDNVSLHLLGLVLVALASHGYLRFFGIPIPVQLFSVFALLPIYFYSGEKRRYSRILQWGFYLFYPAHLLALLLLKIWL